MIFAEEIYIPERKVCTIVRHDKGVNMYTIEDCPHFMCQDCKYFKINADIEESLCKRIDHKKVRFHKNPFSSYHCGEHHIICRDFEPKHPEYADFKKIINIPCRRGLFNRLYCPI